MNRPNCSVACCANKKNTKLQKERNEFLVWLIECQNNDLVLCAHAGKAQEQTTTTTKVSPTVKKKNKATKKEKTAGQTSAQGLAALKSLIAKAAAGTLVVKPKAPDPVNTEAPERPPKPIAASVKVATEVQTEPPPAEKKPTKDESAGQPELSDYWTEEKRKMQNDPAYQSFQKDKANHIKKSSTSTKGTSPPPQTISTQTYEALDSAPAVVSQQQSSSTVSKLKRTSSLSAGSKNPLDPSPERAVVLSGRQLYNSRRFNYKSVNRVGQHSGSTQSLHQSISRDSSPPVSRYSDRSFSPDLLDDGPYRQHRKSSSGNDKRSGSFRHYESDYEDHRFNSGGRHQRSFGRERMPAAAAALESRRRMFERDQQSADRRWDEYSTCDDEYEYTKRRTDGRSSQRDRERVTEYRRYFQQMASPSEDLNATRKPSAVRRQGSQDSSHSKRYPGGQFELYRSRFEVGLNKLGRILFLEKIIFVFPTVPDGQRDDIVGKIGAKQPRWFHDEFGSLIAAVDPAGPAKTKRTENISNDRPGKSGGGERQAKSRPSDGGTTNKTGPVA